MAAHSRHGEGFGTEEISGHQDYTDRGPITGPMRTGRTLGRTLYIEAPGEDWRQDQCIGMVDTPELAEAIVEAVNAHHGYVRRQRNEKP